MRYLIALLPFTVAATLAAQAGAIVSIGGQPPPTPAWDAPHLQFEVAAVKANKAAPGSGMFMRTLPTSFNVNGLPVRMLITLAYRLSSYQLVGGPSWIDSERFDIVAKAPEGSRPDQTMLMLRGLLADRFKLKLHAEDRETQIYALVLARNDGKLGPKLSKSTDDCEKILAERRAAAAARAGGPGPIPFTPPGPNEKPVCTTTMRPSNVQGGPPVLKFIGGGQPIQMVVSQISGILQRRVVDRTGLTGLYDFELEFSMRSQMPLTVQPQGTGSATAPSAPIDDGPTVFDAVRELGLKLESEKGAVEHIIIDSVERPVDD